MSDNVRRIFSGRGLLVTVVTTGVLAGGGAAAFAAAGDDGPRGRNAAMTGAASAAAPSPSDDRPGTRPSAGRVTAVQAAAAALKEVPGKVDEIELDDSRWEIDILAKNGEWRDVTVDAGNGKVVSDRADDDDGDDRDDAAALRKAKVTASEAAEAALRSAPGTVTSVGFDDDDGKAGWEVEITGRDGTEREFDVNAATAKVQADDDGDDDDGDDRDDD